MLHQVNKENFESVLKDNEVVLLDFYADWCGPCKALHPTLEQVAKEFDQTVHIAKVNVDKSPELSASFGVRSIPALFYFKKGELVNKQVGLQSPVAIAQTLKTLTEDTVKA